MYAKKCLYKYTWAGPGSMGIHGSGPQQRRPPPTAPPWAVPAWCVPPLWPYCAGPPHLGSGWPGTGYDNDKTIKVTFDMRTCIIRRIHFLGPCLTTPSSQTLPPWPLCGGRLLGSGEEPQGDPRIPRPTNTQYANECMCSF